jgi:hypothetical protein
MPENMSIPEKVTKIYYDENIDYKQASFGRPSLEISCPFHLLQEFARRSVGQKVEKRGVTVGLPDHLPPL